MKSLERKFNNISKLNPYWSSYTCFTETVRSQNFIKSTISKWFTRLVDKSDYDRKDKLQILRDLKNL